MEPAKKYLAIFFIFIITVITTIVILFPTLQPTEREKAGGFSLEPVSYVKIVVVVDNNEGVQDLETAWGVSMYVETDKDVFLFDTGPDPGVLKRNMDRLSINPASINFVFISHEHGDHTGGLSYLAALNEDLLVYLPAHSSSSLKERTSKYFKVVEVKEPFVLSKGLLSSGELYKGLYEQSLAIYVRDRGLVVLTGCSHPGVDVIVKHFHELTGLPVFAVIGGFHLRGASENRLEEIARTFLDLDVKMVFPIHCTGDKARQFFAGRLGERYMDGHVGLTVFISEEKVSVKG
ncbi:MAG: MBL fold metallo-hydrolase [Thermoprotei archaeon]|nr:MAG: MBL fold metallo-hydrolase [Thermoprotei archaeon]